LGYATDVARTVTVPPVVFAPRSKPVMGSMVAMTVPAGLLLVPTMLHETSFLAEYVGRTVAVISTCPPTAIVSGLTVMPDGGVSPAFLSLG
jgi:hypothetical protein